MSEQPETLSKEPVNIPAVCALLREMDTTGAEVNLHNIAAMLERLDRENAELKALVTNRESTIEFLQESAAERERDIERAAHEPKEDKSLVELVRLFEEAAIAWERHHGAWETDRLIYQRNAVLMALRYSKSLETNKLPTPDEGNGETVGRAIAETTRNTSNTNQHRE